jgi:hypothetical protein
LTLDLPAQAVGRVDRLPHWVSADRPQPRIKEL